MSQHHPIEQPFDEQKPIKFGPYPPRPVPLTDVMRRDRQPSRAGMEFVSRGGPTSVQEDRNHVITQSMLWTIFIVLLASAIGPLIGAAPFSLISLRTLPYYLVFGFTWSAIYIAHLGFTWKALCLTVVPAGAGMALVVTYQAFGGQFFRVGLAGLGVLLLAYTADQVGSHYVYWITANPYLTIDQVVRRREWWAKRFRPFALRKLARRLLMEADLLREEERVEEAEAVESQLSGIFVMLRYPLGFFVLSVYLPLSVVDSLTAAVLLPPLIALWRLCRCKGQMGLTKLVFSICLRAGCSWMTWGRWEGEDGSPTPGLFESPGGAHRHRCALTFTALSWVSLFFIPPIWHWGKDVAWSATWNWSFLGHLLGAMVLPFSIFCTAILCGCTRALGDFYEAIEEESGPEQRLTRGTSEVIE